MLASMYSINVYSQKSALASVARLRREEKGQKRLAKARIFKPLAKEPQ